MTLLSGDFPPRTLPHYPPGGGGVDDGLPADAGCHLPPWRGALRSQGDRRAPARPEPPPHDVRGDAPAREAAERRAARARARARRPRRNAVLEPPPASRVL